MSIFTVTFFMVKKLLHLCCGCYIIDCRHHGTAPHVPTKNDLICEMGHFLICCLIEIALRNVPYHSTTHAKAWKRSFAYLPFHRKYLRLRPHNHFPVASSYACQTSYRHAPYTNSPTRKSHSTEWLFIITGVAGFIYWSYCY